ncbi:MAG: hypothetical protein AAF685_09690 [Cyanobacteria bacterium P01_C01_bin.89]
MNSSPLKSLQVVLSGLSNWLIFFGILWLLGAAGLGWLVNGLAIIFLVLLLVPVVLFLVGGWWLRRNTATADCPVCGFEMTGVENISLGCPSCGEALKMQKGQFERVTPPGTVEVDGVTVVDVTAAQSMGQTISTGADVTADATVIDVESKRLEPGEDQG